MELDFNKYCVVDGSPTTVLPASPRPKTGNKGMPMSENYILPLDDDAAATRFDRVSCNNSEVMKRGSVYQTTKEVSWLQTSDLGFVRKKIEFSRETAPALPLEIINSLCGLDEDAMEGQGDMFLEMSCSDSRACVDSPKFPLPRSPVQSGSDGHASSSPNPRPRPVPDPFVKTRSRSSHRSPLSRVSETCLDCYPALLHSPTHLHGHLRSRKKDGMPVFELSVKSPEYAYIAKAWKAGNSLTQVYTFHSVTNKRCNGNSSSLKFRDSNRESSMIGQMLVSSHLCPESSSSMVTEFVLYDIARSRKTSASHNVYNATLPTDKIMSSSVGGLQTKYSGDAAQPEASAAQPLAAAELHPGLEIAAIVIKVPCKNDTGRHKLQDLCQIKMSQESDSDTDTGKIHVVIPVGVHGLPTTESPGPSPLLERWRSGGTCDCGGWDMACPLKVFTSQSCRTAEVVGKHSALLSVQGKKDDLPVFSMRATEKEKYAVDFHAQLSTLQAFSISVAVLHAAESSEEERSRQNLLHDPQTLADALRENLKLSPHKRADEILPTFMINPPFSPIARV